MTMRPAPGSDGGIGCDVLGRCWWGSVQQAWWGTPEHRRAESAVNQMSCVLSSGNAGAVALGLNCPARSPDLQA